MPTRSQPRIKLGALLGRPAGQGTIWESNLTTIAALVFGSDVPVTRTEVMAASGLARATVSRIVDDLIEARIVMELPPRREGSIGRPVVPLVPAGNGIISLGLEINTASFGACVVDLAGAVLGVQVVEGDFLESDPEWALEQVKQLGDDLLNGFDGPEYELAGVHLSLSAALDPETGIVLGTSMPQWQGVEPLALLSPARYFDVKQIHLGSTRTMAVVPEAALRFSDVGSGTFLYVAGDNFMGCTLVINGEPLSTGDWSGNIGHVAIEPEGPLCRCGARGCLDTYVGRQYLMKRAGLDPSTSIAQAVKEAAESGCPGFFEAARHAGDALGIALANYVNVLQVDTIVLGDGLAELFPLIARSVEEQLERRLWGEGRRFPRLEVSRTTWHAAMVGGALWVLQDLISNLPRRMGGSAIPIMPARSSATVPAAIHGESSSRHKARILAR